MTLTRGGLLLGGRLGASAARPAVVADVVHRDVVDHGRVVGVVDARDVDVVHGGVVAELSVVPAPAFVAAAVVTVSIVHAAVIADARTPVARVKHVRASTPGPEARRPVHL